MLSYEDFEEIASIQASLFTPNFSFDSSAILRELFAIQPELFDGAPTVLPIPQDAPPDIPRITLQNMNRSLKLDVSPSRINLYRTKSAADDVVVIDEFTNLASQFLNNYLERVNARCGRLAAVIRRFLIIENPGLEIAAHFCRAEFMEAPFDNPRSFELHAHKVYTLRDFDTVNSWVRLRSGIAQFQGSAPRSSIIIEQDINTISEDMGEKNYTQEQIVEFYEIVADEFDTILQLYFRGE
jgi:hypothetical protein